MKLSLAARFEKLMVCVRNLLLRPRESMRQLVALEDMARGADLARNWRDAANAQFRGVQDEPANPLETYFDGIKEGPGVWKWRHYFAMYHRHLSKFVDRAVTVVEVGVYSGGSLAMWRHYLGAQCRVHGIDIQDACKAYENAHTTIHIGDQADRAFWARFRESVPTVDVLIDDGGHLPEQQMVTLEEMLPHLRPGGIYICEDLVGRRNRFALFSQALAEELNIVTLTSEQEMRGTPTPFQAVVRSVHLYPFAIVIEKRDAALTGFSAPSRGTEWQTFL